MESDAWDVTLLYSDGSVDVYTAPNLLTAVQACLVAIDETNAEELWIIAYSIMPAGSLADALGGVS